MKKKKKTATGTNEWSVTTINIATGCPHWCRYCFALFMAVVRFHRMERNEWPNMRVREKDVRKRHPKYDGTVMFPSTHDIVPEILEACLIVLRNLVAAGNTILVVTKPHIECIKAICVEFKDYRDQIRFRFTIGAHDDGILSYWEPGAPPFAERMACLDLAKNSGYSTSVSIEPILDSGNVVELVTMMMPVVTDTIWLGKMNCIDSRVRVETDEDRAAVERIRAGQTDERIWEIYNALKDNPAVRWKESIKKVVGLDLAEQAGLDV